MPRFLLLTTYLSCASAVWPKHGEPAGPGVIAAHLRGVTGEQLRSALGAEPSAEKDLKAAEKDLKGLEAAGSPAAAASPAAADSKATNKSVVDDRGARGHFYYSDSCNDCFYKGAQCGCQPALEYFACLTKHCHKADRNAFADKCTALGSKCFEDLDIDCRGPDTICTSKFHQLPVGGVGLTVEVAETDAFCGPFGKCIGHIRMQGKIINAPKPAKQQVAKAASPAPAPVAASSPEAAEPSSGLWLECGLPKVAKPDINTEEDWTICRTEAEGDTAECELSLPSKWLKAEQAKKVYCVLKDAEDGKRLTEPAWQAIFNVHDKDDAKKKPKAAEEPEEAEEPKAAKKPKAAEKPEEAEESADSNVRPPWMAGKKKGKAPPVEVEAPDDIKLEAPENIGGKLPWMVEKEKRQAARKAKKAAEAKEAEKAEEAKDDEKADKAKKTKKAKKNIPNDSGLPWMEGKANNKPPPGAEEAAKAVDGVDVDVKLPERDAAKPPWMEKKEGKEEK